MEDPAGALMRSCGVFTILLLLSSAAGAQTPAEWVLRGHTAARADRHADAIAAYERAIALEPALRTELLAALGRQYLWSDRPARAAELLREYLGARDECDVLADYGLALSWSDRLADAANALERVRARCPAQRTGALLRLGLVRRWQDRPSRAGALYREVLASGDSARAFSARLGLAHVLLLQGYERAALGSFSRLVAAARSAADADAAREGMAIALARLGEWDSAGAIGERAAARGSLGRDLRELGELHAHALRAHAAPVVRAFRDADGTRQAVYGFRGSVPLGARGRAGGEALHWSLESGAADADALQFGALGEYRWSSALAARADVAWSRLRGSSWTPVTGELGAVLTPSDALRVDVSVARVGVFDNFAAIANELLGTYASIGADLRVSAPLTVSGSVDGTAWSEGNRRLRLRGAARWRLEGVPRLTLELPALVQFYDEPMPFGFFSPGRYIEAGPGANLYLRVRRRWNVSAYGRVGMQREERRDWDPFGTVRASAWSDPIGDWSVRASLGWSSSDLASSTAFQRTWLELSALRAF